MTRRNRCKTCNTVSMQDQTADAVQLPERSATLQLDIFQVARKFDDRGLVRGCFSYNTHCVVMGEVGDCPPRVPDTALQSQRGLCNTLRICLDTHFVFTGT